LAEWQEMQSPARARYSPRWAGVGCAPAPVAQVNAATTKASAPAARRPLLRAMALPIIAPAGVP
jgi:hypothetical protein